MMTLGVMKKYTPSFVSSDSLLLTVGRFGYPPPKNHVHTVSSSTCIYISSRNVYTNEHLVYDTKVGLLL